MSAARGTSLRREVFPWRRGDWWRGL